MDLDDLIRSIREEGNPKGGKIVAANFFGGERYERYVAELISQGTIEGKSLSSSERKEAFKKRSSKVEFKTFVDKLLAKKTQAGGGFSGGGGPSAPSASKNITPIQKLLPGTTVSFSKEPVGVGDVTQEPRVQKTVTEVGKDVDNIDDKLDELLTVIRNENKSEKKDQETKRKKEEDERRRKREDRLESVKKFIAAPVAKIMAPIQNVFQRIIDGVVKVLFGKVLIRLVDWFSDENNRKKIDTVVKFISDFWPAIVGGMLLFGTRLGGVARFLLKTAFRLTGTLLRLSAKLGAVALKLGLKAGAGAFKMLGKGAKGLGGLVRTPVGAAAAGGLGVAAGVAGISAAANEVTGQRKAARIQASNKARAQTRKGMGVQGAGGVGDMGPVTPYGLLQGISGGGLVLGMQGGGFLGGLSKFLPGTGTVMAPKTIGNQTIAGYQNKFLGIPIGKVNYPTDSGGLGTGYSQSQMRKYEQQNPKKYFSNRGGALPALVDRENIVGEAFANFGKNVQTIQNAAKRQEEMMRQMGYEPDGYVNLLGKPVNKPKGYSGGGKVHGGYGGGDKIRAMLEPGEFVMSKGAVKKFGADTLAKMNAVGGGDNRPKIMRDTMYAEGGGYAGKIKYFSNNNGGNMPLEPGQTYTYSQLRPHHSSPTTRRADGFPKDYTLLHGTDLSSSPNADIPVPLDSEVIYKATAGGYGNTVVVKNQTGRMLFGHLSRYGNFNVGDKIKAGTIIGTQGSSGGNYADHLHLDAEPAGHEAFVNFITSGKPTFGSTSAAGLEGPVGVDNTTPGQISETVDMAKVQEILNTAPDTFVMQMLRLRSQQQQQQLLSSGLAGGQVVSTAVKPPASNDLPTLGSVDPSNNTLFVMRSIYNIG